MSNKNNPIAIIDIGSSSVRLVIFDEQKFSASVIFNEKVTLNLGKGIFMKRIDESELQNLMQVLKRFFYFNLLSVRGRNQTINPANGIKEQIKYVFSIPYFSVRTPKNPAAIPPRPKFSP